MLVCISTAFVSGMLAGCTNDVYNPDAAETLVPPADTYFSFNTKAPVTLKVDYAMPGVPALIEVYDQKPVATDGNIRTLRQDLTPCSWHLRTRTAASRERWKYLPGWRRFTCTPARWAIPSVWRWT